MRPRDYGPRGTWVFMKLGPPVGDDTGGAGQYMVEGISEYPETVYLGWPHIERANGLSGSLGFSRAPEQDYYVPGKDVLL